MRVIRKLFTIDIITMIIIIVVVVYGTWCTTISYYHYYYYIIVHHSNEETPFHYLIVSRSFKDWLFQARRAPEPVRMDREDPKDMYVCIYV